MFLLKDNPSEKVVIVEKEPDGIGNLEDLPRLVFIEKECGNLNYSLMVETLLEILTKRSQMFYKPIDVRSVTDDMGETASSISIRIIVNQLGKHDFPCGRFFFWVSSN